MVCNYGNDYACKISTILSIFRQYTMSHLPISRVRSSLIKHSFVCRDVLRYSKFPRCLPRLLNKSMLYGLFGNDILHRTKRLKIAERR